MNPEIVPEEVQEPAGVPDGTVVVVREADGSVVQEKIVNEYDEDGNVIGFHKEVV